MMSASLRGCGLEVRPVRDRPFSLDAKAAAPGMSSDRRGGPDTGSQSTAKSKLNLPGMVRGLLPKDSPRLYHDSFYIWLGGRPTGMQEGAGSFVTPGIMNVAEKP